MVKKAETTILITVADAATKPIRLITNRLRLMDKALKDTARSVVSTGKKFLIAGGALGLVSAVPLKFAKDFGHAMTQVQAQFGIMDKTDKRFKALGEAALSAGERTKFSITEAARALQLLATRGFDVKQSIDTLQPVLALAAATEVELAEATEILGDTLKQYKLEAKDAGAVADILTQIHSKSGASILTVGEAFAKSAVQARAAGVSLQELGAFVARLGDAGIRGEEAGTALRNMFLHIANPTAEATAAFKKLGVTVEDMEGNYRNVLDIFEDIRAGFIDLGAVERDKLIDIIFGKRAVTKASELLSITNKELKATVRLMELSAGQAEIMAKIRLDSLTGDVTLLASAFSSFAAILGVQFLPYLRAIIQGITAAIQRAKAWVKENQEMAKQIGFVTIAIVGTVTALGTLSIAIGVVLFAFSGLVTVIKLFTIVLNVALTVVLRFSAVIIGTLVKSALLILKTALIGVIGLFKLFGLVLTALIKGPIAVFQLAITAIKGTLAGLRALLAAPFVPVIFLALAAAAVVFRNELAKVKIAGIEIGDIAEIVMARIAKALIDLQITALKVWNQTKQILADIKSSFGGVTDVFAGIDIVGETDFSKKITALEERSAAWKKAEERAQTAIRQKQKADLDDTEDWLETIKKKATEVTNEITKSFSKLATDPGSVAKKAVASVADLVEALLPEGVDEKLRERLRKSLEAIRAEIDQASTELVSKGPAASPEDPEEKKRRELQIELAKATDLTIQKNTEKTVEQTMLTWEQAIEGTTGTVQTLFSDLYQLSGEKTKEFARISKAAAIADAAIKGAQAVVAAYATVPYPLNIPAALLIAAKVAAQIAIINSQPLSFAEGGYLPITSQTPRKKDNIPILASGGEGILTDRAVEGYGGPKLVHALNRGLLPVEPILAMVRGAAGIVPSPPKINFQAGGVVAARAAVATQAPAPVSIVNNNIVDPGLIRKVVRDHIQSNQGRLDIVNQVGKSKREVSGLWGK